MISYVLKPRLVLMRLSSYPYPVSAPHRQKANITAAVDTATGETAVWTLPEVGLVLDKEYKITYKVRVGKGFGSGYIITLPLLFDGPVFLVQDFVEVLVK